MHNKKVWFITGASRGVGLELVKQLLERGDQVAATTRSLAGLSKNITALGRNFLPLQVDLTNEGAIATAIEAAHNAFGRIDVVVNNAGYAVDGPIDQLDAADIEKCFAINTVATITVMHKVLPYLKQQGSGYILNLSSLSSCSTASDTDLYAATKYATLGFSERVAEEVQPFGIDVTVVAPAAFRSQFGLRDHFTLEDTLFGTPRQAATSFIRLAAHSTPPLLLLLDNFSPFLKIKKHLGNEVQFIR